MSAVVTGATGLIGQKLVAQLDRPRVLSRDAAAARERLGEVEAYTWAPEDERAPAAALDGAEVVFHLAGQPVADRRWDPATKARIRQSRVLGTRHLVEAMAHLAQPPPVLICASAVGIYGDRGDEQLDESSSAGDDFLAGVCSDWEREAHAAEELGTRVVCARIGVVLAPSGGALAKMLTPFRLGVGGKLGDGRQWMPWIHADDVVGLLRHAAAEAISGPLNLVAPAPVRNVDFTRALGKALGRPTFFGVPRAALKLAFGELSGVLLASQRVEPRVARESGYAYRFAELDAALADCL
jgi:uncharacterized protein (TIGR01777 family)